jgi:hypothetical protein
MFDFKNEETKQTEQNILEQASEKGRGGKPGRETKKPKGGNPRREQQSDGERWRDEVSEVAVKDKLFQIQLRRTSSNVYDTGFPIDEVIESISVETQSNNQQGGYASYWRMARAAKDGSLPTEGTTDFENLRNACAEAIVYKNARETPGAGTAPATSEAIFDPVGKASVLKELLSNPFKPFASKITDSVRGKTPDLLFISTPFSYRVENGTQTDSPGLTNIVDPSDPTASHTKTEAYLNKTLISPMEITTSENPKNMKSKVKKAESYRSSFGKSGSVAFAPVIVFDREAFLRQEPKDRVEMVERMAKIGGHVQLISNLTANATAYARAIAPELVQAVATAQRAKPKKLDSKQDTEKKSLSTRLFENPKKWLKNLAQKLPLNNKNTQETNEVDKPIQKESAAESYQRMASGAKSNPSFFQGAGLDVLNNSNHLDLAIASHTAHKNLDSVEILKQSPAYLAKRPAVAKMWLDKMVDDGGKIAGEEHLNTPAAQKIIQNYNDRKAKVQPSPQVEQQVGQQVEQQKSVSDFDRAVALVKEHSSEFEKLGLNVLDNRKDLLAGISFAIVSTGNDPSKLLRQSPEFLVAATPAQGEALIGESIKKAKSTLETAKSEPEPEKQKIQDRGYER